MNETFFAATVKRKMKTEITATIIYCLKIRRKKIRKWKICYIFGDKSPP